MKKYSIGREIVASCPAAFLLTYLSLFVPGEVTGICGDVGDGPARGARVSADKWTQAELHTGAAGVE